MKKLTRKMLDSFLAPHASNDVVLDVGSGGSSYDMYFPNRLTIDIDPARKPTIVGDIHNLPFKNEEFTMVLCTEVIEHVIDPQKAIHELMRVLKPGGKLVLTTRFVYPLHDVPHDYWRYTKYNLTRLFSDYKIIELKAESKTFYALAVLVQRVCFQTKLRFNVVTKLLLFGLSYVLSKLDFLVVQEFGDIKKETKDTEIMTTGYYMVVSK